ncbi:hypothetical protein [Actinopolymorpha pittospori]|uniref:Uncharacterized protein n=1 Tax=Actinopolymorpha pittospori TaxID=648752 RepID=A0A927N1N0_9ACTN|nr:hypothetical protein [Actinopolymorpha pittospori]MBE1607030.1 hypothetical protein [Actinopolymorpha pittospori]
MDAEHMATVRPSGSPRRVAGVMALVAVSLAVASALHLSGRVDGRSEPFDAQHAGIAEAILCVVLLLGVAVMLLAPARARTAGLIAGGFTTLGFLWGLNLTARGGHWPDISYHLVGLPLLVGCCVVLLRARDDALPPGRA